MRLAVFLFGIEIGGHPVLCAATIRGKGLQFVIPDSISHPNRKDQNLIFNNVFKVAFPKPKHFRYVQCNSLLRLWKKLKNFLVWEALRPIAIAINSKYSIRMNINLHRSFKSGRIESRTMWNISGAGKLARWRQNENQTAVSF